MSYLIVITVQEANTLCYHQYVFTCSVVAEDSSVKNAAESNYFLQRAGKPGPKPNKCVWCDQVQCSHCQCPGYARCDHENGKPCSRSRYKRRLVCNTCEKAKLREEGIRKLNTKTPKEKNPSVKKRSYHSRSMRTSTEPLQGLSNQNHSSFDVLYMLASQEANRVQQSMVVKNSTNDGDLAVDGSTPIPIVKAEWRVTPCSIPIPVKEEPSEVNSTAPIIFHGSSPSSYMCNPSMYYPVCLYGCPYSKQ